METEKIFNDISNLPPEAQQQVIDFIAFLSTRYQGSEDKKRIGQTDIVDEPFIGMWKDRDDLMDSGKWVRNARKSEWGEKS